MAAAIILATGCSHRMGAQNKLLLPIRGVPIISHVAKTVLASRVEQVIVDAGNRPVCKLCPGDCFEIYGLVL